MKFKILIPSALVVLAVGSFAMKEQINEKYLQLTINENLRVIEGAVNYCGYKIKENETPDNLIQRVKSDFNGPNAMRMITDEAEKIFPDSEQSIQLNKKILEASDSDKQELINAFNQSKYETYLSGRTEFSQSLEKLLGQFACETGDKTINDDLFFILESYNPKPTDEAKRAIKETEEKLIHENKLVAVQSIDDFTNKFLDFVNSTIADSEILNTESSVDEKRINHVITVSVNSSGMKNGIYEVGCDSVVIPINPHFGTSIPIACFIRKSGDRFGKTVYLFNIKMLVEDYKNEEKWSEVKKLTLKEIS
ncbi:hypothetical protein FXE82_08170 [Vibrio cholerae]|uniref:hypothetical protein n=1 Tax=Vibrio cholerae TaxID=666 RepID=UPI0010FEAB06|nr:hypothetical protein [Vibrio cholerae]NOE59991.1 hypothetical protein [Vibrio cholerae]TLE19137.1 hypothetical protein D2926_18590 [Vibrio cholerae]TLE26674.1 hypothetical protein D2927_18625 [Vibrio cholerae]TLE29537.1 hypothetical protein D2928_18540 [Vibrio cholerae]TLE40571.1 hypothetical protein D2929_18690 [Vibrio cholerae]